MSSSDEGHNRESFPDLKKRRVQRACDVCRRRKARCDGGQMPSNRCTNCIMHNLPCTYVEAAKKRSPPKGYVDNLERRLKRMEDLLKKHVPDLDVSKELEGAPFNKDIWLAEQLEKRAAHSSSTQSIGGRVLPPTPPQPSIPVEGELDSSDDETALRQSLVSAFRGMKILNSGGPYRFFGKSSSAMLLKTAIDLKHRYDGQEPPPSVNRPNHKLLHRTRPDFWAPHPWTAEEYLCEEPTPHEFPPEELIPVLIDLYFNNSNDYTPLLHRPTFEKCVNEKLHLQDNGFGSTLLLVCALGARFSDDPRVLLQGTTDVQSAGWQWFRQVRFFRQPVLAPPRLYDLQVACLMAMYLQTSSTPQASWTIIGLGIRMAQDVGAHRRKVYDSTRTAEEELWKRSFWVLVTLDRLTSFALGRSCAIQDEDFDLELPIECDDEYWISQGDQMAFEQPPGKPSKLAFWNCIIRMNQIMAFAMRTIYSINKSKVMLGFVGPKWEQHIVTELDSSLNQFIDSVPEHLRWNPHMENVLFLNQSAFLYASYYTLQISVHRPFISSPSKSSRPSFPSLAICTNAARSCIHVVETQMRRSQIWAFGKPVDVFTAGIFLILNIWEGKRSGFNINFGKEMEDVHRAMDILERLAPRWYFAGRLRNIMNRLVSASDLPLPHHNPNNKRARYSDELHPSNVTVPATQYENSGPANLKQPQSYANSTPFSQGIPRTQHQSHSFAADGHNSNATNTGFTTNDTLPVHSGELGSLPLYPTFDFSGSSHVLPHAGVSAAQLYPQSESGPSVQDFHPSLESFPHSIDPGLYEQFFSSLTTSLASTTSDSAKNTDSNTQNHLHTENIEDLMFSGGMSDELFSNQFDSDFLGQWFPGSSEFYGTD